MQLRYVRIRPLLCTNVFLAKPVRQILSSLGYVENQHYEIHIDDHTGIVPVLNHHLKDSDCVVLCGDNTYGMRTTSTIRYILNTVWREPQRLTSICLCSRNETEQLDGAIGVPGTNLVKWVDRTEEQKDYYLRTPWFLTKGQVECSNLLELLNTKKAVAWVTEDDEWNDLGTPAKVKAYYHGS